VRKFLPPFILAISLGMVYLATLAPGLSWANDGSDGGDLITAAATSGIAHPTGYPLYLLIAKFFQLNPFGSLAFRTNLLSALAAVLAALLVYIILVYSPSSPAAGNWLAGMAAGYALGLSPVFWSQAVISEVYALHVALVAMSHLLCLWIPESEPGLSNLNKLRGLVAGLALGNQLTAVFLLPAALLSGSVRGKWKFDWRSLGQSAVWYALGLLIYLILPLRAMAQPIINWGNPVNFNNFTWLVSGALYQGSLLDLTTAQILERIQAWAYFLVQQFSAPGIVLGVIGLIIFFKPTRLYFITIFNAIIFSLFAIQYSTFDSYVYLLPVYLSFAVWIGLGLAGLLEQIKKYRCQANWAAAGILLIWFAAVAFARWPQVDASQDMRAEEFGARVMREAPEKAIVFAKGDKAVFTLWYFHFALKQRTDLIVISNELLPYDWYADSLRAHYPDVHWPEGILWAPNIIPANKERSICEVSYFEAEMIACKSSK